MNHTVEFELLKFIGFCGLEVHLSGLYRLCEVLNSIVLIILDILCMLL